MAREMWVCLERVPTKSGTLDTTLRGVFTKKIRAQKASDGKYVFVIPVRVNEVLSTKALEQLHGSLRV